ncbi:MAG: hypothetical protein V4864_16735 [Pseudomonadota bacterium]
MNTRPSRLPIEPGSHLPSINTFGGLSHFLRGAVADEESRQLSESLAQVAVHIEAIVAALRLNRQRSIVAPQLVDLLTVLRGHRLLVVNLGLPWRGLYEYAMYLQSLNNFRVLIGQWLLEGGPGSRDLMLGSEDFELIAWRTLGDGTLLIDMYEQWLSRDPAEPPTSALGALPEPQVQRAVAWWKRLRR